MGHRTIREALAADVEEVTGSSLADASDDTALVDLDIDSLDLIEVGMMMEEEFGISLNSDSFEGVATVGAVVATLEAAHASVAGDRVG